MAYMHSHSRTHTHHCLTNQVELLMHIALMPRSLIRIIKQQIVNGPDVNVGSYTNKGNNIVVFKILSVKINYCRVSAKYWQKKLTSVKSRKNMFPKEE